ncbi:hypothetical protein K450DRAFT_219453 [Umbelopsis ramanniana AG]|uniref:Mid2 domain-containing protein n=1 Tax=Umbelopsis ramanniana AG TaxID=1314678 RepID=A0AAD5HJI5_UMBRA|nr:uncharacterized protein K450DRAFT_219453 [Umbelopsis ramanniana AG]KAI8584358.1 hypothetical protein K450DRAFT_219453 [Umbelopsis ramanniana AG]
MLNHFATKCLFALVLVSEISTGVMGEVAVEMIRAPDLKARQLFPSLSSPALSSTPIPVSTTSNSLFSSFTPIVTLTGPSSSSSAILSSISTAVIPSTSVVPSTTSSLPPTTTSRTSSIMTSSSIAPVTSTTLVASSSSALPTPTAQPQNSGSSMSPSTTKIVIIVCSTVGGVLVLALIGMAWRRWGRRRKDYGWDEDDFFGTPPPPPQHMPQPQMNQYNYNHHDPFKMTLDQYHRNN